MQKIYISLIRTGSPVGKFVAKMMKDDVTHAAIALDRNLDTLHSFGRVSEWNPIMGGFRKETYRTGYYSRMKDLPGVVMEMDVTDNQYALATRIIKTFIRNKNQYRYSFAKLISNLFGIEVQDDGFICSEFVAYVLQEAGVVSFNAPLSLVRPQVLFRELLRCRAVPIYVGDMKRYRMAA